LARGVAAADFRRRRRSFAFEFKNSEHCRSRLRSNAQSKSKFRMAVTISPPEITRSCTSLLLLFRYCVLPSCRLGKSPFGGKGHGLPHFEPVDAVCHLRCYFCHAHRGWSRQ
jgi:hypothetical protein